MAVHRPAVSGYGSLGLAFLGDAVFSLMIRRHLLRDGGRPVEALSRETARYACAKAQSTMYYALESRLTEPELDVMKRGRNAKSRSRPKNADITDYRRATGLEALFGWLYLNGETGRAEELFAICLNCLNIATEDKDWTSQESPNDTE